MEAVRNDAAGLARFLGRFPKGGDLHNHVAGAVYAESYLGWAREDGLRIDGGFTLVDPSTCGAAGEVLRCGTPAAAPACDLTIRYLGQVGRTSPAPLVFA
jgi:adenosine deaminase